IIISLFISFGVFLFLLFVFEAAAAFFAYIILILLIIIGYFLESHYYKKGNKLYWAYALAFTIILSIYLIILHLIPYSVSGLRGLFY
ncbi:MAG: hypothetical protein L6408_04375, partial [Nanoarchaeota archaeon]|nr:hypothetical protein [Nanoarchaeota archaeon]